MLRIIDTETCGLQGGIVEIASVDVVDGKIVNPMSHLVRPDRPISPQAMAIHRITEAMVADKPWMKMSSHNITAANGTWRTMQVLIAAYYPTCPGSGFAP